MSPVPRCLGQIMVGFAAMAMAAALADPIDDKVRHQLATIHEQAVFADMHAHPSRFHRNNVDAISASEVAFYRANLMDLVVANVSSDMAFDGRYTNRDGSRVERGKYRPAPGEAYALTIDRLERIRHTVALGHAVAALSPQSVFDARAGGQVAVMAALEGGDGLEGRVDYLRNMHAMGLRLLQLVHFRNNELGHMQTWPYSPGGLTPAGREIVVEANRLGIIIDLAHANEQTIDDVLALSTRPVVFSHGGVRALTDHDRAVTDRQIRAIAANGGVVGIWPHGKHVATLSVMADYIDHVVKVGGIDHVGIGSDLRGVSAYSAGFDDQTGFLAIAQELLARGYSETAVGKVMGGNFFRVWLAVAQEPAAAN